MTIVRPYDPRDREEVRALAVDTADRGDPSVGLFNDKDLLADWLTDYYLEREPGSCFVATDQKHVVGYLTGSLNTSKYTNDMVFRGVKIFWRGVKRGLLFRRATWKALFRTIRAIGRVTPYKTKDVAIKYPAHFHINLDVSHRGKGVGKILVETFVGHARAHGVGGIHLGSRTDNPSRLFFERMGFREHGRGKVPSWNPEGAVLNDVALYVKELR